MKTIRVAAVAALIAIAGCSGGSHVAPAPANGAGANGTGSGSTGAGGSGSGATGTTASSTMTITITRQAAAASSSRVAASSIRKPQVIPATATSVDAQVWAGATISDSSRIASSCVNFSQGATTATLTVTVPQGQDALQLTSYDGACTGGGNSVAGTLGQGNIMSQFIGAGTVTPSSVDIGAVFNGATGNISLAPYAFYSGSVFQMYRPQSIASTFQYPSLYGYNGSGMTVAIVIGSGVDATDLSQYLSDALVPSTGRTITFESVDGASTGVNTINGSQDEAALDVQTIAGLAPGANIVVYVTPDLGGQHLLDAYNQIMSDITNNVHQINVVSMSYGGCEPTMANNIVSTAFATGAAAPFNLTWLASSGDQGSTCFDGGQSPGVNHPAADPNVIGVGGNENYNTSLPFPQLTSTVAWNDSFFGEPDGTGGGPSSTFDIPTYQAGLGGFSTTKRNVPDIAMPAEGVAVLLSGDYENFGGTSWSAPEAAAMFADIYSYCGRALANSPKIPYAAYAASTSNYIDVTSGNNFYSPTAGSQTYNATAGYDDTTGLGLPLGMKIAETMCPGHMPISTFSAALAPAPAIATPAPAVPATTAARPLTGVLTDMGVLSGSSPVTFQVGLRHTATLATDEQTVVNALQSAGFTVTQRFATHLIVDATGPSSTVSSYFAAQMHSVNQALLGARYAPVGTVTVPASIAPYVLGVNLENVVRMKTGPHLRAH